MAGKCVVYSVVSPEGEEADSQEPCCQLPRNVMAGHPVTAVSMSEGSDLRVLRLRVGNSAESREGLCVSRLTSLGALEHGAMAYLFSTSAVVDVRRDGAPIGTMVKRMMDGMAFLPADTLCYAPENSMSRETLLRLCTRLEGTEAPEQDGEVGRRLGLRASRLDEVHAGAGVLMPRDRQAIAERFVHLGFGTHEVRKSWQFVEVVDPQYRPAGPTLVASLDSAWSMTNTREAYELGERDIAASLCAHLAWLRGQGSLP